jgi:hypothetical protein
MQRQGQFGVGGQRMRLWQQEGRGEKETVR